MFIILIRVYQRLLSPFFGGQCRFTPSCSHYAIYQFQNKPWWKAVLKSGWRILRCNPWNPGGYDLD